MLAGRTPLAPHTRNVARTRVAAGTLVADGAAIANWARIAHPEGRMFGLGEAPPAPSLLIPQAVIAIATGHDEGEELAIAGQVAGSAEGGHLRLMMAIFVVPAVPRVIQLTPQPHPARGDVHQAIRRGGPPLAAGRPIGMGLDEIEAMLAYQHRGGLQVDALMLDAHEYRPEGIVPTDGQGQGRLADHPVHRLPHPAPVVPDRRHWRPVVVGLIQVVPAHFVHAHGEHGLQPRVQALLHQAGKDELVDEKGRRMPQVEDQGVTQADRFTVIGLVLRQQLKEGLVAIEGGVKVIQDLGALGFRVRAIETWGTGEDLVSHHLGPGVWVSSTASSARLRGCQETTGLMACFVENNDMFIESFTWVEAA